MILFVFYKYYSDVCLEDIIDRGVQKGETEIRYKDFEIQLTEITQYTSEV